ncbi:hypothetical protein [Thermaurantiacus sp.]
MTQHLTQQEQEAPVALVSGTASAVGAAVAQALADQGFHVLTCAPDARDSAALVRALAQAGDRLHAILLAGDALATAGLNAMTADLFRTFWEAEVERVVLGMQEAMRALRDRGAGGSLVGIMASPGEGPAGAAAAGAIEHFCRIAAVEAGAFPAPVRVNMVRAGKAAKTEGLAAASAWLAGPRSRMVTGVTLVVGDGG